MTDNKPMHKAGLGASRRPYNHRSSEWKNHKDGGLLNGAEKQQRPDDRPDKGAAASQESAEIVEMRQKYEKELENLRGFVQNWSDEELLFVIQEAGGDVELAFSRIDEGRVVRRGL